MVLVKSIKLVILFTMWINFTWAAPAALDHAYIARRLVHQANWAAVGTISINSKIEGYPFVDVISVNDENTLGQSSGHIRFLLTDLDYTGSNWPKDNKVSFLYSDEQLLNCKNHKPNAIDPMEPTCARVTISGHIKKLDQNAKEYNELVKVFVDRHPAAAKWLQVHTFDLCELEITNIIVRDAYGPPQIVQPKDFYNVELK